MPKKLAEPIALFADESAQAKEDKPHFSGHRARLRQRFMKSPDALPDYELLEMLLYAAIPRADTKPLAKELLQKFGSLRGVAAAEESAIRAIDGCGDSVIAALKLPLALARRILLEEAKEKPVISSWKALLDYCNLNMGLLRVEQFRVLFLNRKNMLIADEMQAQGTIDQTTAYPREIVRRVLELGASAVIVAHNHPSGDPTPSRADIELTDAINNALSSINVSLHDHIIIAGNEHFSFKSNGLL